VAQQLTLAFAVLGALAYRLLERWPWLDCAYASIGVLTTVGIVVAPKTFRGTLFTAALNLLSMGVTGTCIVELFEARRAWARRALRLGGDAPAVQPVARLRQDALLLGVLAVPPWLLASAALCRAEGWAWGEGALLTLMCSTGLGMGDLEPKTGGGKALLCGYLLYAMGSWFNLTHVLGLLLIAWWRQAAGGGKVAAGTGGAEGGEEEEEGVGEGGDSSK
jgi:hypothetical protein